MPYPIRLLRCERNESIHEWLFPAGCSLLALLLHSSTDSEAAAAAVDDLLLEDIRFAEELRPLIRTRNDDAVRAFFPNMRAKVIEAEAEAEAGEEEEEEEEEEELAERFGQGHLPTVRRVRMLSVWFGRLDG